MARSFQTGGAASPLAFSQREDLANFISNIVRDDVPFMSSIGKGKASAILHEWSTDTLERPGVNTSAEGEAFPTTVSAGPNISRLGNYTQIFTKSVVVSGTIEAVNKAGRKSEFKYQSEKRGKELMRDMEFALVSTRQLSNGSGTRTFGGYQSWAPATNTVNSVVSGTVAAGTSGDGDGKDVATFSGSNGSFALSQVDNVMQNVWQNGGKPSVLMMSPLKKRNFSVQAQGQESANQNVRRNIDDSGKLTQSVTLYESDFGLVKVIPNYIMAGTNIGSGSAGTNSDGAAGSNTDSDILVYDASSFKMATLRPLHHRDISEDGDRLRALMVHETSLECMNPQAVGLIGNLNTV